MSKVITFSRTFPAYHPKAGQPTYFVEKFWESIYLEKSDSEWLSACKRFNFNVGLHGIYSPKHHTIRAGKRWKVGDKFSLVFGLENLIIHLS